MWNAGETSTHALTLFVGGADGENSPAPTMPVGRYPKARGMHFVQALTALASPKPRAVVTLRRMRVRAGADTASLVRWQPRRPLRSPSHNACLMREL